MSRIRADRFVNNAATGAPELTYGAEVPVGYGITGAGGINITGVVTATSFSGDGSGLTNITADSATTATNAQGLTGTPDITVRNITGVAATFSGTLTYEDVTNIDSVGLVTARSGLHLTGVYKENITAVPALEIDCSSGNYFTKTISGISTFTFANVPSSGAYSFTLELTHTSGTVSWPTSVKWPSDTAPTLSTGKTHLFMFLTDDGGTRFRGSSLVDYVN